MKRIKIAGMLLMMLGVAGHASPAVTTDTSGRPLMSFELPEPTKHYCTRHGSVKDVLVVRCDANGKDVVHEYCARCFMEFLDKHVTQLK